MRIDMYSDTICPWCYIGKHRLERALEQTARSDADIHWHAFQLYPQIPREGMDREAFLRARFRHVDDDTRGQLMRRVIEAAREEGLAIDPGAARRFPNTLDSHRLIWRAKSPAAMTEALFRAYLGEGRDIGDHRVLAEIAAAVGEDRHDILAFLAGEEGIEAVRRDDAWARQNGIGGVPLFLIEGQFGFTGAQSVEVFQAAFAKAAEKRSAG